MLVQSSLEHKRKATRGKLSQGGYAGLVYKLSNAGNINHDDTVYCLIAWD